MGVVLFVLSPSWKRENLEISIFSPNFATVSVIRSETVSYNDFIENNGWVNSKTNGKMRLEGKDYIVKDGDVLNFRFNT